MSAKHQLDLVADMNVSLANMMCMLGEMVVLQGQMNQPGPRPVGEKDTLEVMNKVLDQWRACIESDRDEIHSY